MQNQNMMKQLQEMQAKMAKMQEELAAKTVEGTAGGGAVTVSADGQQRITAIKIDPDAMDDAELLGDMVMAACNEALDHSRELAAKQMGSLLPPGMI